MRLIDADALLDFIDVGHLRHPSELCFSEIDVANMLLHAPTISPDEVRGVGEWLITDAYPHRIYCSVCYKTYLPNADSELWSDGRIPRNYCPNCGAKMEVSEDA